MLQRSWVSDIERRPIESSLSSEYSPPSSEGSASAMLGAFSLASETLLSSVRGESAMIEQTLFWVSYRVLEIEDQSSDPERDAS
jgi:hypothetical protein